MPQFTGAIAIDDGSATPVAVSYSPELLSSAQTVLVDRRLAAREQQPSITLNFDRATTNRKTFKVSRSVAYPIVQTVNGVEIVVDIARAKLEYIIPTSMTAQARKHLRALIANIEDVTIFKAGVEDLDPLY